MCWTPTHCSVKHRCRSSAVTVPVLSPIQSSAELITFEPPSGLLFVSALFMAFKCFFYVYECFVYMYVCVARVGLVPEPSFQARVCLLEG